MDVTGPDFRRQIRALCADNNMSTHQVLSVYHHRATQSPLVCPFFDKIVAVVQINLKNVGLVAFINMPFDRGSRKRFQFASGFSVLWLSLGHVSRFFSTVSVFSSPVHRSLARRRRYRHGGKARRTFSGLGNIQWFFLNVVFIRRCVCERVELSGQIDGRSLIIDQGVLGVGIELATYSFTALGTHIGKFVFR